MAKLSLQGIAKDLNELKTQFGELKGTVSDLTQQMRFYNEKLQNIFDLLSTPVGNNSGRPSTSMSFMSSSYQNLSKDPESKLDDAASYLEDEDQIIKKTHPEDLFSGKPGFSCFYMFVRLSPFDYVLYRMDIEQLNYDNIKPLLPLLTFGPNRLPKNCKMVHLGDYLYFVGEKASHVFMIAINDIKNLHPDENRLVSDDLLKVGPPMKGPKVSPHVFVAKGNLYVFSQQHTRSEMYCPSTGQWTVLEFEPRKVGTFVSHFVLDDKVYFGTEFDDCCAEYVLSFNLTGSPPRWNIVSTSPRAETSYDLRPVFRSPVVLIGDMLFGPDDDHLVAASPYSSCKEATKSSFMRPTVAPSLDFWSHLCRFDIFDLDSYSDYYTTLETKSGQNVLCVITYGNSHSGYKFPHAAYVHFAFYKIPGGWYPEPLDIRDSPQLYALQKEQSGCMLRNHFKSEFMHEKLFKISTTKSSTGRPKITCFFC